MTVALRPYLSCPSARKAHPRAGPDADQHVNAVDDVPEVQENPHRFSQFRCPPGVAKDSHPPPYLSVLAGRSFCRPDRSRIVVELAVEAVIASGRAATGPRAVKRREVRCRRPARRAARVAWVAPLPRAARRMARDANASSVSCRIHRMRSAAASGWSPNSWTIRLMQPRWPSCRTVRLITSVKTLAVRVSDHCSPDANSASHRAWLTFNRFMASLPCYGGMG
jgi:hypothetical protein